MRHQCFAEGNDVMSASGIVNQPLRQNLTAIPQKKHGRVQFQIVAKACLSLSNCGKRPESTESLCDRARRRFRRVDPDGFSNLNDQKDLSPLTARSQTWMIFDEDFKCISVAEIS